MDVKCVANFSGGAGSFVAAQRAIERYGAGNTVLLFCDTKTEDADLYRFLDDCERLLPAKLVRIADGRDIWQVFRDERFLGNSRVDPCSKILKRELADRWIAEHCPTAVRVFGIDFSESHRARRLAARLAPAEAWFPLLEKPLLDKRGLIHAIEQSGIATPRLYLLGAPHNNCGGACVKAGHAHFRWLHRELPCVYAEWERKEQECREYLGADVSILKDRRGGQSVPLTLAAFRKRIETRLPPLLDEEWGGCGCFVDE